MKMDATLTPPLLCDFLKKMIAFCNSFFLSFKTDTSEIFDENRIFL